MLFKVELYYGKDYEKVHYQDERWQRAACDARRSQHTQGGAADSLALHYNGLEAMICGQLAVSTALARS